MAADEHLTKSSRSLRNIKSHGNINAAAWSKGGGVAAENEDYRGKGRQISDTLRSSSVVKTCYKSLHVGKSVTVRVCHDENTNEVKSRGLNFSPSPPKFKNSHITVKSFSRPFTTSLCNTKEKGTKSSFNFLKSSPSDFLRRHYSTHSISSFLNL